ncbi:MAG: Asp-tRNA(Asn)/Glu-tRNA(Gln) amidotransferase subunit GatB [Nanoarchaeota archaeon]
MVRIKCGLEIHVYVKLDNNRKLFCNCLASDADPNTNICPICTAQPGAKPQRPNKEALQKTIAIGLILGCRINELVLFQRKHYNWPDLPAGYQRTMSGSYAKAVGEEGSFLGIGIEGVHLEEDPAKWDPETGIVDYNRCGKALVEIVTKPEFTSSQQVRDWLKGLVTTLKAIDAIDENSGVKADVNVSVEPNFNRVEIKNIHSFKGIADAIDYEAKRQVHEINEGKIIGMETRTWHDDSGRTVFMRSKETAQDYMFIPDPDLPAIRIPKDVIDKIESTLPERPDKKAQRYIEQFRIDSEDANIIAGIPEVGKLFDEVASKSDSILASKFIRTELLRALNNAKKDLGETRITPKNIIDVIQLLGDGRVSDVAARRILERAVSHNIDVHDYVKESELGIKEHDLDSLCEKLIQENPKAVDDYKFGKAEAINFMIGKIIRELKGTVDAKKVKETLQNKIR